MAAACDMIVNEGTTVMLSCESNITNVTWNLEQYLDYSDLNTVVVTNGSVTTEHSSVYHLSCYNLTESLVRFFLIFEVNDNTAGTYTCSVGASMIFSCQVTLGLNH